MEESFGEDLRLEIRGQVEKVEEAFQHIRKILQNWKDAPFRLQISARKNHLADRAKVAYRLSLLGVPFDIIARAFEISSVNKAQDLVVKGEILCHRGRDRQKSIEAVLSGARLWDSGLFSTRVTHIFQRVHIETLDGSKTLNDIGTISGIGPLALQEIEGVLKEIGRKLRG